jgi:hypothetical protein
MVTDRLQAAMDPIRIAQTVGPGRAVTAQSPGQTLQKEGLVRLSVGRAFRSIPSFDDRGVGLEERTGARKIRLPTRDQLRHDLLVWANVPSEQTAALVRTERHATRSTAAEIAMRATLGQTHCQSEANDLSVRTVRTVGIVRQISRGHPAQPNRK